MEFSDVLKQTGSTCVFSPNGQFVANAVDHRLTIREVQSAAIVQIQTCVDVVQQIGWSSDSLYLFCALYKRGLVQVWSIQQPDWTCKIDEGSAGLEYVRWAPDGRHILTTSEFELRMTIWSLVNPNIYYVKNPKYSQQGVSFTADGKLMAVLERVDCKDQINIFSCSSWLLIKSFVCETNDAVDIMWSPDGRNICVYDSPLTYKVCVYSPDGRPLASYSAYDEALGIKSVSYAPSGQFLAIGSYDETLRLLGNLTWKKICEFPHPTVISPSNVVVYKEEEIPLVSDFSRISSGHQTHSKYVIVDQGPSVVVPYVKPEADKPNPRMGVSFVSFSSDCHFIATKNDTTPSCLWIWHVASLTLKSVLLQTASIKAAAWHPTRPILAVCTGLSKIFFWTPAKVSCLDLPLDAASVSVGSLSWSADGGSLLLGDKDRFCMCYPSGTLDTVVAQDTSELSEGES